MNTLGLFKAHNFANRVISYQNEDSISMEVPGAYYDDALSVNNTKLVKTGWNTGLFNNGIVDNEFIYGKGKRTEFRNILNRPVKDFLCKEDHYGGIGKQGYLLNDFQRMIYYNKLTDDYGWHNLGDALFGDVVYSKTDTSFTLRSNYNMPSDDKITELQAAGIIDKDLTVHGVFPKAKPHVPHIRTYRPDNQAGSQICTSFWYRRSMITNFNAYQDWHNLIWIKKPGEDLNINRRGKGRNFLVPLRNMNFMEPDKRRNVPVEIGQPIALESSLINVRKEDYGFILHIHQINTNT
tara:strand:+ start:506 stop:1387 length:882 start_codon:yes stop_codon:yes gene_type:complete